MNKTARCVLSAMVIGCVLLVSAATVAADEKELASARAIVADAKKTLDNFMADPDMAWFRDNVQHAQGVLIVPSLVKAGFVFGGSGGMGVLLGKGEEDGLWSYPAFFGMGSGSFGFQAGVEKAEVILMVMTRKGMDAMLATSFKLGADTSVALGPVGAGAKAQTADILAFSRSKGVFGGMAVEGAVIKPSDSLDSAYYGRDVRTIDILVHRTVENPNAQPLIETLAGATR